MYTVPIIPPDLRHEETIIQAANALDCLQKTINSVFENIDARINRNNVKIQELGERIGKAQAKIKGLVGTKKAIKIYAPARFPSTKVFQDIPLTFAKAPNTMEENKVDQLRKLYEVQSRVEAPSPQATQDKLVFFHVRTPEDSAVTTVAAEKTQVNQNQGLGAVPKDLRSLSSVLLFDTDESVYGADNAQSDKNAWKHVKHFKQPRKLEQMSSLAKAMLEPAPHSLTNRNQRPTSSAGLRYTPKLNEAPEIDLPLDLPDLPGIADDLQYEGKDQQQIAPSIALFIENLPDLQELEQQTSDRKEQTPHANETAVNIPKTAMPNTKTASNTSIPPPPPPPPSHPPNTPSSTVKMSPSTTTLVPPPPPPPPPPAMKTTKLTEKPESSPPPLGATNNRSDLMDAIRKAGGVQGGSLRHAAAAPIDSVDSRASASKPSSNKTKAGSDLMSDLHNKLLMRRKGISGLKEKQNNDNAAQMAASSANSNPVISRLSALIPPPTARNHSDDDIETENDTDWAD